LWLNGSDLRAIPLVERKWRLVKLVKPNAVRMLYVQHILEHGRVLFDAVCRLDLEGIVAKPSVSPYRLVGAKSPWLKVKNPEYSQTEGRGELFNRRPR
jgi:bifunctional non-homologous end joining protein LigD